MEPSHYAPLPREAHAFVDGLLTGEQERAFERRLAADADLRQSVNELQTARKLLGGFAEVEVPAGFDEAVRARIRRVEMARSALASLRRAPAAWWQRVALVGAGAVAAAAFVVVVGAPGLLGRGTQDNRSLIGGLLDGPAIEVTEGDILPILADQYHRFREVSHQVAHMPGVDADSQREFVRAELATSDLTARAQRLAALTEGLPTEQRRDYGRFLGSLSDACDKIDAELVASRNQGRAPNLDLINGCFAGVQVPERLSSQANVHVMRSGPAVNLRNITTVSLGNNPELAAYARARQAFYARDYAQAGQLLDSYLTTYTGGRYRDNAMTAGLTAHMRAGNVGRAGDLLTQIKIRDIRLLAQVDAEELAALDRALAERGRPDLTSPSDG